MALQAGYAKIDILPPSAELHLAGTFAREPRLGLHHRDPLLARALALREGERTVVILAVDVLCISEELHAALVDALDELGPESVFLAATHTHSSYGGFFMAGAASSILGAPRQEIFDFLVSRLAELARLALLDLAPARARAASAEVPGLVSSRRQADGPHDDQLVLLRLVRTHRRPIDVVAVSGHPVMVSERSPNTVSGDYPGELCRHLEARGSDPLFLSAALGGVSILFPEFQMDLERHMELVLRQLDEGHRAAEEALQPVARGVLERDLVYLSHGPHQSRLFSGLGLGGRLLDALLVLPRRRFRKTFEKGLILEQGVPLHLVRLGDFCLVGTPADLGVSVLLGMRKAAKRKGSRTTLVASQVNAYAGYIHTSEVYRRKPEKGYRFMAYYENGLAVFGYELGDRMVEAVAERLG